MISLAVIVSASILCDLPDEARTLRDVRYATFFNTSAQELSLFCDIHQPDSEDAPATGSPLVIVTNGGGWTSQSKSSWDTGGQANAFTAHLVANGYTVAALNCPSISDNPDVDAGDAADFAGYYPGFSSADDAAIAYAVAMKAAVRFFGKNYGPLGIDITRVFVGGWSAGAISAGLMAYAPSAKFLDHNNATFENGVIGVGMFTGSLLHPTGEGWVDGSDPACFIWHGSTDFVLPPDPHVDEMTAELTAQSVSFQEHSVNGDHNAFFEGLDTGNPCEFHFELWADGL